MGTRVSQGVELILSSNHYAGPLANLDVVGRSWLKIIHDTISIRCEVIEVESIGGHDAFAQIVR